jgi:hypothetical protein
MASYLVSYRPKGRRARELTSTRHKSLPDGGGAFVGKAKPPNGSFEQRASSELVKLVWKLRWISEEEEAKKAQMQLERQECKYFVSSMLAARSEC